MLSKFSTKKPLTIVVAIIIIAILGVISYTNMGVDLLPEMDLPYLVIVTIYAGAEPDVIETQVTIPLENAFSTVSGIEQMNSSSNENYSLIIVALNAASDTKVIQDNLESAIALADLPDDDLLSDPLIMPIDMSSMPVMYVSVGLDSDDEDEVNIFLNDVIDQINSVDGVANVSQSGIVEQYAILDSNSDRTAAFLTEQLSEKFNVQVKLSDEQKEELRLELKGVVDDAKNNPDLQTNGKIDTAKVLDAWISAVESNTAPPEDEETPSEDSPDEDEADDATQDVVINYILSELKNDTVLRSSAINLLDNVIANDYILEDGEENKKIFNSLLDGFTQSAVEVFVETYMSALFNQIDADVFQQVIYAQDFNLPAGSVSKGANSYIVKVGDNIHTRSDFMSMPVYTIDVADTLATYLQQLEFVLTLMAVASEDGKVVLTDSQLHSMADAIAIQAETTDDYEQWFVDNVTSDSTVSPYYMNEEARAAWVQLLKDEGSIAELTANWDEELPVTWRTQLLTHVKNNELYPADDTIISNSVIWDEDYTEHYVTEIDDKINSILFDRPAEGNYQQYAEYVYSLIPSLSEENQTMWSDLLTNSTVFTDAVDAIDESDTLDWQKATLSCVTSNSIYPDSWSLTYRNYVSGTLTTAYSALDLGRPQSVESYAELAVTGIANLNRYAEYYLNSTSRELWVQNIATSQGFIDLIATINADDDYMLVIYRYLYEDANTYFTDETDTATTLLPIGASVIDSRVWNDSEQTLYDAQITTLNATFTAVEDTQQSIRDNIGEDTYDGMMNFFRNRTAEENYNLFIGLLDSLGEFGGEGAVVKGVDEESGEDTYTVDIRLIEQRLENLGDDLKITLCLNDLADITFIDDLSKQVTKLILGIDTGEINVERSVQLSIEKEPDASSAEVTNLVKERLQVISQDNEAFTYTVLSDDGSIINFMLSTVGTSLLLGGLLAILILIFFLKDIKATFVIGSSIAISVMFTFVLMYFCGISLNAISMGGLALGVGMLVDNSIVVLENTYRLRAKGYSVLQSAVQGAKQMTPAIFASTLTTCVVFLPIIFVEGIVKEIMSDMALTICFSLFASLLVSLTLVPVAYHNSVGKGRKEIRHESKIERKARNSYLKTLNFALNNKFLTLFVAVVLLAVSVYASLSIGIEYFPNSYMGYISISVTISNDAIEVKNAGLTYSSEKFYTYEDAEQDVVSSLTDILSGFEDVYSVGISRSSGMSIGGMNLGDNHITATVTLVEEDLRSMSAREIESELQYAIDRRSGDLYDASVSMYSLSALIEMTSGEQTLYLYGDDYSEMQEQAKILSEQLLANVDGVTSVDDGVDEANKEYRIVIDKNKASLYGLTVAQVYLQVQEQLSSPSSLHTLTISSAETQSENLNVYLYSTAYASQYWYKGVDSKNKDVRIYFINNSVEDDSVGVADYYVKNSGSSAIYTKKTADSDTITLVESGEWVPVSKSGDAYSYFYSTVNEEEDGTHTVTYTERTFTQTSTIKYYTNLRDDIDLITMNISSSNLLDESAEIRSVQLYNLLSDECLQKDEEGNILYRQTATDVDIPVGIALVDGYTQIAHREGRKCITMTVYYDDAIRSTEMQNRIDDAIATYNTTKPLNISATTQSTGGLMDGVFESLYLILGIAVVLIFLVMVAQFQSWKSPFIIMCTVFLAFTGSFILLFAAGMKLNIMSLIGLIILMGVVVNNGIVFVDYANRLIEDGCNQRKALLRTGVDRIRPILMTAITTVIGMSFMALDTSDYGELLQPLAVTAVGGLSYATLMTLFVVPVLYDLFNKGDGRAKRAKAFKQADFDSVDADTTEAATDEMDDTITSIIDAPYSNNIVDMVVRKAKANKKKRDE